MSSTLGPAPVRLNVRQQNLNKSQAAHEDLINSPVFKNFDVLVLQEPFMDSFGNHFRLSNVRPYQVRPHQGNDVPNRV